MQRKSFCIFLLAAALFMVIDPSGASAADGRNRLREEKSPYLLQHKNNPVWWWSWGKEAFQTARREKKLVFLSVGYSTCHWCHVMEHESFEDKEVADYLNKHFISIKVDREERPDIDRAYMSAVQAMTGRGGWPMSVLLTADRKPFFGGTYFPKASFLRILEQSVKSWQQNPERLTKVSERIVKTLQTSGNQGASAAVMGVNVLQQFLAHSERGFDRTYGGFGRAPKFPPATRLRVLLRIYRRTGSNRALEMVETSLKGMAYGGMHDHLGGGFHRYSTDAKWLVPHFEKMLYDNAVLAEVYLETFQVTGKVFYRDIALSALEYILRDMTSPEGAFYSAEDADSEGAEGIFYVWKSEELKKILGQTNGEKLSQLSQFSSAGNFEHGQNIIHLPLSAKWDVTKEAWYKEAQHKLLSVRSRRIRPRLDDKVLTAWNGLMISAMAKAGRITGQKRFLTAAERAAQFVSDHLVKDKSVQRRFRDGEARFDGVLDDYAYFIYGLIELYQATQDSKWITLAVRIQRMQDRLLLEREKGGYKYTTKDILAVDREFSDNARPNANGLAAGNLLRLADLTLDDKYRQTAEGIFGGASEGVVRYPFGFSSVLMALDYHFDRSKQVVIVLPADPSGKDQSPFLGRLFEKFIPNSVIVRVKEGSSGSSQPFDKLTGSKKTLAGKPTAYVCEFGSCKLPTNSPEIMMTQVNDFEEYPSRPAT